MVSLAGFFAVFFPGSGFSSPFRPMAPFFLSRNMVRKPFSASQAPFCLLKGNREQGGFLEKTNPEFLLT
jgi:hypothetical protein